MQRPTSLNPDVGVALYRGVIATAGGRELEARQKNDLAVSIYTSPPYDLAVPGMSVSRLSINLTDSVVLGRLEGDRTRRFDSRRHSLFYTPANTAAHWRKERPSRHINIYFDAAALQAVEARDFGSTPLLNGSLPATRVLVERLVDELTHARPFALEAVDSLARLILVGLGRRRSSVRDEVLGSGVRARVDEFIDAHLGRRLFVSELAQAAGLSPARFAQAFARSAGKAPHQYVLDRRVERAVNLLRRTTSPLADVAATCGFSSQQHMARLVRARLGTTPGGVRGTRVPQRR